MPAPVLLTHVARLAPARTLLAQAAFVEGRGHSSHVTNVRFNKSDSYLVTLGGNDRTVCVWRMQK